MKAARALATFLLALLLALLLGEGLVRVYFAVAPAPGRSPYLPDPDSGYRLRPGPFWEDDRDPTDRINSLGFRDREHSKAKPPGTYRMVGIGDSFVLGAVPIEKNFLRLAEAALNDPATDDSVLEGGASVDVMLMGLGGYSPENEVGVLRSAALPMRPDLVVLCFYVGNDVTGIALRGQVLGGQLYFVDSSDRLHALLRKSRLFVLVEKVIVTRWRLSNLQKQRDRGAVLGSEPAAEAEPTLYYRLIVKKRLPVFERVPSRDLERLWRRTETALEEFDRLCRAAEIPWILLVVPTEEQVDPEVRRSLAASLDIDTTRYDFEAPQRRLAAFAGARGIRLLDLLPVFREERRAGARLYIPNDTHWNAAGNELAARALVEEVRARRANLSPR